MSNEKKTDAEMLSDFIAVFEKTKEMENKDDMLLSNSFIQTSLLLFIVKILVK